MGEARNRAQNKLAAARKGCHGLSIKPKERERDKGREKEHVRKETCVIGQTST